MNTEITTSAMKIEKGVPIPPKMRVPRKAIFHQMEVGDSVFMPGKKRNPLAYTVHIRRTRGWKFTSRKVEGGVRIWRVE